MILAAGLGTRLRPLTYELPKPVIPVLGRPLCTYNMEFLHRAGVRSFVLNLHHHPKLVQQKAGGWTGTRMEVGYTLEPVILGTGGGILNARNFLEGGTFVTANGDTIARFPFERALAFHRKKKALATLVLFPNAENRYTPVRTDGDGRITGFGHGEGPGGRSGFYTGFQILEPAIFASIPKGKPSCIVRETYATLAANGAPVYGFLTDGSFLEFGTPADYLEGTLAMLSATTREGTAALHDRTGATLIPPVHVSPKAMISAGARIGPGAVIEDDARVGEGASVSRSILWPGAVVPRGAEITRAVLTPRHRVDVGREP